MQQEHFNSLSKIVLVLEYDGTAYAGFQWQKGRPTVQSSLEEAIFKVTGENRRVIASSRTDAGVHARFQVVSFRTATRLSEEVLVRALNFYLPPDIAVKAAQKVEFSFNVQKHAISREYEYWIYNNRVRSPLLLNRAYHVPYVLDIERMNVASRELEGEHDFASFASFSPWAKNTVRTVYKAFFERQEAIVKFKIKASSFLTHQVRHTVGFLLEIGSGKRTVEELKQVMQVKKPGLAGPAVPAYGLYLTRVYYPENVELKYENLFNQSW